MPFGLYLNLGMLNVFFDESLCFLMIEDVVARMEMFDVNKIEKERFFI